MGTLRVSFWQQVVVWHAPYGTENNGRALFYFIFIPSIVSLFFLYCSLYPSFQISFFFSSHEIPTPAIPVHDLQSSLISSIIFEMLLWWPQVSQQYMWLLPHVSYKRWFVCIHLLFCVSLSFVCFFGLLWSKYIGYLKNMCRIHNSFTFKEYHYFWKHTYNVHITQ